MAEEHDFFEIFEQIRDFLKQILTSINDKLSSVIPHPPAPAGPPPPSLSDITSAVGQQMRDVASHLGGQGASGPSAEPGLLGKLNTLLDSVGSKLGVETRGAGVKRINKEQEEAEQTLRGTQGALEADKESLRAAQSEVRAAREMLDLAREEVRNARERLSLLERLGGYPGATQAAKEALEGARAQAGEVGRGHAEARRKEKEAHEAVRGSGKAFAEAKKALQSTVAEEPRGLSVDWGKMGKGLGQAAKVARAGGLGRGTSPTIGKAMEKGDLAGGLARAGDIAMNIPQAMEGNPIAIARLAKEAVDLAKVNLEGIGRNLRGMGQAGGRFMESERFEDLAGSYVQGAKGGAKTFANAVAPPGMGPLFEKMIDMNPMVQFTEAIVGAVGAVRKWTDQLHEANMRFAEFSGSMAGVQARQMYRDITLGRQRGERRAPGAEDLAQSRHRLNENAAVFEDAAAIVKTWFLTRANDALSALLETAQSVFIIRDILKAMGLDKNNPTNPSGLEKAWLDEMNRTLNNIRMDRPPHWR